MGWGGRSRATVLPVHTAANGSQYTGAPSPPTLAPGAPLAIERSRPSSTRTTTPDDPGTQPPAITNEPTLSLGQLE